MVSTSPPTEPEFLEMVDIFFNKAAPWSGVDDALLEQIRACDTVLQVNFPLKKVFLLLSASGLPLLQLPAIHWLWSLQCPREFGDVVSFFFSCFVVVVVVVVLGDFVSHSRAPTQVVLTMWRSSLDTVPTIRTIASPAREAFGMPPLWTCRK